MALLTEETIEELLRQFPAQPAAALAPRPPPRASSGRHGTTGTCCSLVRPPSPAASAAGEVEGGGSSRPSTRPGQSTSAGRKKLTGMPIHTTARAATRQQLLQAAGAAPSSANVPCEESSTERHSRDTENAKRVDDAANSGAPVPAGADATNERNDSRSLPAGTEVRDLSAIDAAAVQRTTANADVVEPVPYAGEQEDVNGGSSRSKHCEKDDLGSGGMVTEATTMLPPLTNVAGASDPAHHDPDDGSGKLAHGSIPHEPVTTKTGPATVSNGSQQARHTTAGESHHVRATTPRSALPSTATITPTPRHAGQGVSAYRATASAVSLRSDDVSARPPTRSGAGTLSMNAMARVERSEQRKHLLEQQLALERVYWSTKYAFQGLRTQVEQHIYARELAAMWTQRTDRSPYWLNMVDELQAAMEATLRWKRNPEFVVRASSPQRMTGSPPPAPPTSIPPLSSPRVPSPTFNRRRQKDGGGRASPTADTPTRARGQAFDGVARALLQSAARSGVHGGEDHLSTSEVRAPASARAERHTSSTTTKRQPAALLLPPVDHRLVVSAADAVHVAPGASSSSEAAVALYEEPRPMPLYAQPRPYPTSSSRRSPTKGKPKQ